MSQQTPIIGASQSGLQYRTQDNDGKKALLNHHKGTTAPIYVEAGCIWLDDTVTPWLLKIHDGTDWIILAVVDATSNKANEVQDSAGNQLLRFQESTLAVNYFEIKNSATGSSPKFSTAGTDANIDFTFQPKGTGQIIVRGTSSSSAGIELRENTANGSNYVSIKAPASIAANAILTLPTVTTTIAGVNIAQEYTAAQNFNATILTDALSIAWDAVSNQVASVTLAGNRTLAAPTNLKDGATYILTVKQDAIGGRTLAYNTVFKFAGGTAPTVSTAANAVDILTFISDGTNMNCVFQGDFK